MILERERKFLVLTEHLPLIIYEMGQAGECRQIKAGYFTDYPMPAVRVTIRDHWLEVGGEKVDSPKYHFCVKGRGAEVRPEFEIQIPRETALLLMEESPTHLSKERFDLDGWEIDRIRISSPPKDQKLQELRYLWLAEWEEEEGKPPIPDPLPLWIGEEVTHNPEYSNQRLSWKHGLRSMP